MRFEDKAAIVTGGASGIGKEVATRFVAEGGPVVINLLIRFSPMKLDPKNGSRGGHFLLGRRQIAAPPNLATCRWRRLMQQFALLERAYCFLRTVSVCVSKTVFLKRVRWRTL
jgi:NAD(P)-dependent dehydrogenase (short-subunit alcohol dehydrogenase family)